MTEKLRIIDQIWLLPVANGIKVGLTNQAQEELGNVTFATFPKVNQVIKKNETLIELEAEKAVSEVLLPFTGTVESINEAAEQEVSLLDDNNQLNAWIAILTNVSDLNINQ